MPGYRCRGKGPPTRPFSPGRKKKWPEPARRKKWATWCLKEGGESDAKIRTYLQFIIQALTGNLTMEQVEVVGVVDVLAKLEEKCNLEPGYLDEHQQQITDMFYEEATNLGMEVDLCLRRSRATAASAGAARASATSP